MPKATYGTILFFVVLSLIGLLALSRLSIRLNPQEGGKQLNLDYHWQGASPEASERQVTALIEGAMSTLQGVEKVSSVSRYNGGYVRLNLQKGIDEDQLRFEAAAKIRQIYSKLPDGMSYPVISLDGADEEDLTLISLQLNGDASPVELYNYADQVLKPRFSQLKDLSSVNVYGGLQTEWRVAYNRAALATLGISKGTIVAALNQWGQREQLGWIRSSATGQLSVGIAHSVNGGQFPNVPLGKVGDRIVWLQDVAKVSKQEQRPNSYFRLNGRSAVLLRMTARRGANQLVAAEEVRKAIQLLTKQLPPSYGLRIDYDASEFIQENLDRIAWQSGAAVLILLLVLAISVRKKGYLLLIISSLLVTILISALLFYSFGIEMHLYSLAALTVSLGLLLDNVIVMADHYQRYRQRRVTAALLGATLTSCAALTIIWFLPDETRRDLTGFAQVLIIMLSVSLVVAYFFVPSCMEQMSRMMVTKKQHKPRRWQVKVDKVYGKLLQKLVRFRWWVGTAAVLAFGIPVFLLPDHLAEDNRLAGIYNETVGSSRYQEEIRQYVDKALGGTLRLFVNYVYENSFYQNNERTVLHVSAGLPNQSTVEQMNELLKLMEAEISKHPEVDRFITNVYNGQQGRIEIYFKREAETGGFPYQLKARLISTSTEMSGIDWNIYGVGQGFSQSLDATSMPSFNLILKGYNYLQLEQLANQLKEQLQQHPRVQDVDINKVPGHFGQKNLYAFTMDVNEAEMGRQNISRGQLNAAIGSFATRSRGDISLLIGDSYDQITLVPDVPGQVWDLQHVPLQLTDSVRMKLTTISTIRREPTIPEIRKEDQQYLRQVSFNYMGSHEFGRKFLDRTLVAFKADLPLGYSAEKLGFDWWRENAKRQYELILIVIVAIFIIGAVLFESFRQPFVMIFLIPLSFIGVFVIFYVTGFNFDQGGYAAFLLLSGLAVNAVIFISNEYNHQLKQYPQSPVRAYRRAVRYKIRPVLLSILTTVLSLTPFLWQGEEQPFWPALALGTIGGLVTALIALLLFAPVIVVKKS